MIAKGEVPMVDCAIFADTQSEPRAVYVWLDWLERQLPFPVHRVSAGNLLFDVISRKDDFNPIPAYKNGSIGRRQCTWQYKLRPLHKKMRELAGLAKGERADGVAVECQLGISADEIYRMKPSQDAWRRHSFPLIDLGMTRGHCLEWMSNAGYPKPPRSACVFCPYLSDAERDQQTSGDHAVSIAVDTAISAHGEFIHRSERPLAEVDLTASPQAEMFNLECEGMCGV
jgi:hypothetical protein